MEMHPPHHSRGEHAPSDADVHTCADASACVVTPAPESKGVRLFGVKLSDYHTSNDHHEHSKVLGLMRKSLSMGNLGLMGFNSMQRLSGSSMHVHKAAAAAPVSPWMEAAAVAVSPWTEAAGLAGNGVTTATQPGYASDGLMQSSSMSLRERRKGVPWTEDEHRSFLAGLQKLGKGDWRGISRTFVTSRTPTQVASHAQKYFLRQSNLNKRKRRSSLFDIINSNAVVTSRNSIDAQSQNAAGVVELPPPPPLSIGDLHMLHPMAPSNPLTKAHSPATPINVSADLCLGRSSFLQGQGLDKSVITISTTSSSSRSLSSSPSSSSLCRIDEASELSSLSLSIAPPMSMDLSSELALKLEPPKVSRQSAIFSSTSSVREHTDVLLIAGA